MEERNTLLLGGFGNVGESPDDLLALVEGYGASFVFVVGIEQLQEFLELYLALLIGGGLVRLLMTGRLLLVMLLLFLSLLVSIDNYRVFLGVLLSLFFVNQDLSREKGCFLLR